MRIKTIFVLLITILLTVIIMQNTGKVWFTILFIDMQVSKLLVMLCVAIIAFVLGWLVGRPKRVIRLGNGIKENESQNDKTGTLSDEDKDYIN